MVKRVLLLVAIALVLIGVATLIVGIFSDTLIWVFISIGSTVLAGVVLYILYRLGRRQVETEAPAPAFATTDTAEIATTPIPSTVPPLETPARAEAPAATTPASEFAPVPSGADVDDDDDVRAFDDQFPIAEYDDLRVAEILPLLPELDADELSIVRDAETDGKARATILARIDELAGSAPVAAPVAAPVGTPVAEAARPAAAVVAVSNFPIAGYDTLKVAEILPLVRRLDADELEVVADYEERNANRQTILNLIDTRLDSLEGSGVATSAPAKKAAAASTVKKAPAKRAAASKAPAQKAAARKTAATKAPVPKAAAAKASATRSSAPGRAMTEAARPAKAAAKTAKSAAKTTAAATKSATRGPAKSATKSAAKKATGPATAVRKTVKKAR